METISGFDKVKSCLEGVHTSINGGLNREGNVNREGNQGEESDWVENSSKSCRTAHLERFGVKSRTAAKSATLRTR